MIIDVLVCKSDGTQVMEQREVPDTWAVPEPEPTQTPAPTDTERLRADVDYIAVMTNVDFGEV